MEKRVLAAALISAVFLGLYSQFVLKPATVRPTKSISNALSAPAQPVQAQLKETASTVHPIEQEEVVFIESAEIKVEIGKTSGSIRNVILNSFQDGRVRGPLRIGGNVPLFEAHLGEMSSWSLATAEPGRVAFVSQGASGSYQLTYALGNGPQVIEVSLQPLGPSTPRETSAVTLIASWAKADDLGDRYNPLEAIWIVADGSKKSYKQHMGAVKSEKNVPRGTSHLSLTERYFCVSIKPSKPFSEAKLLPSPEATTAFSGTLDVDGTPLHALIYYGPRDYFYLKQNGFEEAFHVGTLGQIGLILLSILGWIAGVTKNYGVAIIALSALVTCAMAPFTLLGFRSMRRMQELKPKIDRIMAEHKSDPTAANKQVLALYKEHKVSPLGGCVPMLLQIPVFIALFQAISHSIGLRGQRFLWIADLSLPDRLLPLPFVLPFIGKDFNLLPILMAGVMYFQTKQSQQNMSAGASNPTANMMAGPLMPIIFGVMFYQFSAGLVLYWITNSVMAMIWYRVAK